MYRVTLSAFTDLFYLAEIKLLEVTEGHQIL